MPLPDPPAWLAQPWALSSLVPFLAGLVTAELLHRMRLSGLALLAGVFATALLAVEPAARLHLDAMPGKILAVLCGAAAFGLLFDVVRPLRPLLRYAAASAGAATMLWVGWPTLIAKPAAAMAGLGALALLHAVWTTGVYAALAQSSERVAAAATAMGVAAGVCMLADGPNALGHLTLAAGAASGAHLLIQLISNQRLPCGALFALPAGLAMALLPAAAMLAGTLPWTVLVVLALVPAAALVPVPEHLAVALRGLAWLVACAIVGGAAVALKLYGPAWALS
jgi:hypothetical protein